MAALAAGASRDTALLHLLAAGETRSEGLAMALHIPVRTARWRLAQLRDAGLVESRTRGTWTLSGAGQRAALAATVPEPTAPVVVLDALPAEHQAMLSLIEDAVVARRSLHDVHSSNWPGFLLLGPTKSGKTLVGTLAARRFGLDPIAAVRLLIRETPGSLLGRREQTGPGTWRTVPSPLLALPLVTLDEFDKAIQEKREAAFAYLDGASRYQSEDGELAVYATAIVTLNPDVRDPSHLLPDAYLRRAVVLDTTPLRSATRDLDVVASALASVVLPQVSPDLAPPASSLPDDARGRLRLLLRNCLTERGWELVDVEAVSRLVLGRWATLPTDLTGAVLLVAADYLLVTGTREGLVQSDWPMRLETVVGHVGAPIGTVLAAARARAVAHEEQQAARTRAELDATMALAGEREALLARLDYARDAAPRGKELTSSERDTIAKARGAARPLRTKLSEARSLAALAELDPLLEGEVLVPLRSVAAAVKARRGAAAQTRHDGADARRREAVRKQARHTELQILYRQDTTRPGDSVIAALLTARCLERRTETYEAETWGSMLARGSHRLRRAFRPPPLEPAETPEPRPVPLGVGWEWQLTRSPLREPLASSAGPAPVYETKIRTWYEDRDGRRIDAAELVAWDSEAVLAVIQAAAVKENLPRLTRPRSRRREPTRRASPSSSRRP